MNIAPTAQVDPNAVLGKDVEVGPNSVIGPHVKIGDATRIGPNCVIVGHTVVGRNNWLVGNASLGTPPQDLSYRDEPTRLVIGDNNTFREFVTVNVGTAKGDGVTTIGSNCLFMACSHVGHDSIIGDGVILVNNALLGGHVQAERVQLRVHDVSGRVVRHLVCEPGGVGLHEATWDGTDDSRHPVGTEVYLCQLRAAATERYARWCLPSRTSHPMPLTAPS